MCFQPTAARRQLQTEIQRLLELLASHLVSQRGRGRTPAADAVSGLVIEEGEAEGLLAALAEDWARPPHPAWVPPPAGSPPPAPPLSADDFRPLLHAQAAFVLGDAGRVLLTLALAAEVDARFGRLYAYLNDHIAQTRPTLGLAVELATLGAAGGRRLAADFVRHPAIRDGLVVLEGEGPLPGRSILVEEEIVRRLVAARPEPPSEPGVTLSPPDPAALERLVLRSEVRRALAVWSADVRRRTERLPALLLAGSPGSGRATAAAAAAGTAGLPLVAVEVDVDVDARAQGLADRLRLARREARWYGAALLLELVAPLPPAAALWHELVGWDRPLLCSVPPESATELAEGAPWPVARLELTEPGLDRRRRLWQALLPAPVDVGPEDLDQLATAFRFGPGRIARTVRLARGELALAPPDRRRLTGDVLHRAARRAGAAVMGPLAQRLPLPYRRQDLVIPPRLAAELDLALAWVRRQPRVLAEWGFGRRIPFGEGLTGLFSGPPGTGKTMTAQILASELGLDLYRVDLSRVMSKYIGETEKNLAQLFDECHRSGAVLFFDEADALFGKRSEVKDAHDRYANVEIGYLLQRMEEHDGIVVLATNRQQDMDEAFLRRFDVVMDFPVPDEADRLRIWRGMFPPEAEVEDQLDLPSLARRFELSGGEIRNTVLAAAYLAAGEERPIGMAHLRRALKRELIKGGRVVDERELGEDG